jgi:NADH-quinone oxidoreductase subunit H
MVLFGTSIFAECNRLPFDLPESEQELVGGYHTEYSSMKFALFLFGEYTHMITTSFLMMAVFFGGWHLPFITDPNDFSIFGIALKFAIAAGKTVGFIIFYMLIRWTILRFRFDQLMHLAWKIMLPISLASFTMLVFMSPVSLAILLGSGFIGLRISKPSAASTKTKVPYLGHGAGYSVQHDSKIRFESLGR